MNIIPQFYGSIEKGKLTLNDRNAFDRYINFLSDGFYIMTVKKFKRNRSNQQNKYYWGGIIPTLQNYFGFNSPEEMHEAIKLQFLVDRTGKLPTIGSTAKMSTVEFEDFAKRIREWASIEYGVYIGLPNEYS
jgi:hypothetical protein